MTASNKLSRKNPPRYVKGMKNKGPTSHVYAFYSLVINSDQPSIVTLINTLRNEYRMLSKFVMPYSGFLICLPQKSPSGQ
jgi:hypothetical protein